MPSTVSPLSHDVLASIDQDRRAACSTTIGSRLDDQETSAGCFSRERTQATSTGSWLFTKRPRHSPFLRATYPAALTPSVSRTPSSSPDGTPSALGSNGRSSSWASLHSP